MKKYFDIFKNILTIYWHKYQYVKIVLKWIKKLQYKEYNIRPNKKSLEVLNSVNMMWKAKCKYQKIDQIIRKLKRVSIEAVAQRFSVKKVSLEISQNSQENTCARNFFK